MSRTTLNRLTGFCNGSCAALWTFVAASWWISGDEPVGVIFATIAAVVYSLAFAIWIAGQR